MTRPPFQHAAIVAHDTLWYQWVRPGSRMRPVIVTVRRTFYTDGTMTATDEFQGDTRTYPYRTNWSPGS